ncbi:hypothetical protein U1Q18_048555 [Sarracenia purpurea var. burkii]
MVMVSKGVVWLEVCRVFGWFCLVWPGVYRVLFGRGCAGCAGCCLLGAVVQGVCRVLVGLSCLAGGVLGVVWLGVCRVRRVMLVGCCCAGGVQGVGFCFGFVWLVLVFGWLPLSALSFVFLLLSLLEPAVRCPAAILSCFLLSWFGLVLWGVLLQGVWLALRCRFWVFLDFAVSFFGPVFVLVGFLSYESAFSESGCSTPVSLWWWAVVCASVFLFFSLSFFWSLALSEGSASLCLMGFFSLLGFGVCGLQGFGCWFVLLSVSLGLAVSAPGRGLSVRPSALAAARQPSFSKTVNCAVMGIGRLSSCHGLPSGAVKSYGHGLSFSCYLCAHMWSTLLPLVLGGPAPKGLSMGCLGYC